MLHSFLLAAILLVSFFLFWPSGKNRNFILISCAVFVVAAMAVYQQVGAPEIVPLLEQREEKLAKIKASITLHSERIKKNSKDIESWVILGDNFMQTTQYSAAANAYKQSVLLSSGNPKLIMAYARAMIFAAGGKVGDHSKHSLEVLLLQEPKHEEARYYLAVKKLQDGKTGDAMSEMKALYNSLPDSSPIKKMINRQIGRSQ